ncbi:Aste57867_12185 [Aphanomyces stellatus]|uniref:Aste57867_12185 protein n=1 Tax=Aphanomyces stellatus TaxID=120398 RepID=A0A485KVC2_9STRA|nr:hypothetical protein As57867_012140 [Aphanomyces stellatus]VFT89039.1 Aste57867_12185 [Aphanomyces stellatus]
MHGTSYDERTKKVSIWSYSCLPMPPPSVDPKKRIEAERMRKVRAEKKVQMKLLEVLKLKADDLHPVALAVRMLRKHNQELRQSVERQALIARLLASWVHSHSGIHGVLSQGPLVDVASRRSSPGSLCPYAVTLLGHPVARKQGFQWLTEKLYHNAIVAFPQHPLGHRADDDLEVHLRSTTDDVDDTSILGIEMHVKHTFFGHYQTLGNLMWTFGQHHSPCKRIWCRRTWTMFNTVHSTGVYEGTGTNVRRIVREFEDSDRIVLTHALIAQDELFPFAPSELRTHGYVWTVLEKVIDSITPFDVPFCPSGVASLDDIGRLFHLLRSTIQPTTKRTLSKSDMWPKPHMPPTTKASQLKQSEAYRQRILFETLKTRRQLLRVEVSRLKHQLTALHSHRQAGHTKADDNDNAVAILEKHNRWLRKKATRQDKFLWLLYEWEMTTRRMWRDATLLANPWARQEGLRWLSERVYHNALQAVPFVGSSMDDCLRFDLHTFNDDDDDGHPNVFALDSSMQRTLFYGMDAVADAIHKAYKTSMYQSFQVQSSMQEHINLYCGVHAEMDAHDRVIERRFNDANRMILTYTHVPYDESLPNGPDDLYLQGFAWIIMERVTDSITLLRFHHVFPSRVASCMVVQKHNQALRADVERQYKLAHILYMWVASQQPVVAVQPRSSWLEATLLMEPVARLHGFQWLSQRVFHAAMAACRDEVVYNSHWGFNHRFVMPLSDDDDDGVHIDRTEMFYQDCYNADFNAVVNHVWMHGHTRPGATVTAVTGPPEATMGEMYYFCGRSPRFNNAISREIWAIFAPTPNRVVATSAFVGDDECDPAGPMDVQFHGYDWTVMDRVSDSQTLMRHFKILQTPVMNNRRIPLVDLARANLHPREWDQLPTIKYRQALVERIRSGAEAQHLQMLAGVARAMDDSLQRHATETNP